jgi:hypothetical protein
MADDTQSRRCYAGLPRKLLNEFAKFTCEGRIDLTFCKPVEEAFAPDLPDQHQYAQDCASHQEPIDTSNRECQPIEGADQD